MSGKDELTTQWHECNESSRNRCTVNICKLDILYICATLPNRISMARQPQICKRCGFWHNSVLFVKSWCHSLVCHWFMCYVVRLNIGPPKGHSNSCISCAARDQQIPARGVSAFPLGIAMAGKCLKSNLPAFPVGVRWTKPILNKIDP